MAEQETDDERLRALLTRAADHLEWAQGFATGGPGADQSVKEINRLLGAIYYALGVDEDKIPLEKDADAG